jgi:hypothetical protein
VAYAWNELILCTKFDGFNNFSLSLWIRLYSYFVEDHTFHTISYFVKIGRSQCVKHFTELWKACEANFISVELWILDRSQEYWENISRSEIYLPVRNACLPLLLSGLCIIPSEKAKYKTSQCTRNVLVLDFLYFAFSLEIIIKE